MLHLALGSSNPAKRSGTITALCKYGFFEVELHAFDVPSGVSEQPLSLEEIILGARNRASGAIKAAADDLCGVEYGIGIESGIMLVPSLKRTWVDVTTCVLDNGQGVQCYGQSFGFVVPNNIMDLVIDESLSLSDAVKKIGLTRAEKVGNNEGLIGILSHGVDDRASQVESAVRMALMQMLQLDDL